MYGCGECIHKPVCDALVKEERRNIGDYLTGGVFDDCPLFKSETDFEEVVRCKDCEFFGYAGVCEKFYEIETRPPDHFCSYGKKKGENGNGYAKTL